MSDKYYLHDCNSYTHSCQNSYRVERKESAEFDRLEDAEIKPENRMIWWRRLLNRHSKPQQVVKS